MNEHFIARLIEALVLANVIQPFDKQRATDVAKDKFQNEIHIVWNVEDVMTQAEQDGVKMTEEKAREVLAALEHRHDASIGTNWDTLSFIISEKKED